MPTAWANRGGGSSSSSAGGPSLGLTSHLKIIPYGAYRSPRPAPTANTRAWAASSHPLPVMRTRASTMADIVAPNRAPLGSIFICHTPFALTRRLCPANRQAEITGVHRDALRLMHKPTDKIGNPVLIRRNLAPSASARLGTQRRRDAAEIDRTPSGQQPLAGTNHVPDAMCGSLGCHRAPFRTIDDHENTSALRSCTRVPWFRKDPVIPSVRLCR